MFLTNGCSSNIASLTMASTKNVQNIKYEKSSLNKIEGESCYKIISFIPVGTLNGRIEEAMDNAIDNGHTKNIKGTLLANVNIANSWWYIPYIYGEDCITVKGNLIDPK